MKTTVYLAIPAWLILVLSGCANPMHYSWAYVPLHDAKSSVFQPAAKNIDYREVADNADAIIEAESSMHRDGYVMVGYVNMMSPQPKMIGRGGAKKWGEKVGASRVLHAYGKGHYLATYWAKPKHFILGAFYKDDLPEDARVALKEGMDITGGVLVHSIVSDSPAFSAGIQPGDLLISLNGATIQNSAALDNMLKASQRTSVTFVIWSMLEGLPRPVEVALQ
jgi:membrane-associated protease RseP (regulator of RpoE activity)